MFKYNNAFTYKFMFNLPHWVYAQYHPLGSPRLQKYGEDYKEYPKVFSKDYIAPNLSNTASTQYITPNHDVEGGNVLMGNGAASWFPAESCDIWVNSGLFYDKPRDAYEPRADGLIYWAGGGAAANYKWAGRLVGLNYDYISSGVPTKTLPIRKDNHGTHSSSDHRMPRRHA